MAKSTISMAIFNSYVKLPEGTSWFVTWAIITGAPPLLATSSQESKEACRPDRWPFWLGLLIQFLGMRHDETWWEMMRNDETWWEMRPERSWSNLTNGIQIEQLSHRAYLCAVHWQQSEVRRLPCRPMWTVESEVTSATWNKSVLEVLGSKMLNLDVL